MKTKRVMIVEDNKDVARVLTKKFEMEAYAVTVLSDGLKVLSRLYEEKEQPHALILDLMLPGRSGAELLNTIKSIWPLTKIFIFSAHQEYAAMFPKGATDGFFLKTKGLDSLIAAVNHSLG